MSRSTTTFQTPISHRINVPRIETFASAIETPKSAMKSHKSESKSADALDKIDGIDDETIPIRNDRKENPKIRFVQCTENEPNYHTPISFKMNKFMMCFKSEPDLSRVQSVNDEPILNRGRFIARKLLSGVSMINLRRPFASSSEKATIPVPTTTMDTDCAIQMPHQTDDALDMPNCVANTHKVPSMEGSTIITNSKIDDDDEDFVDDEEVDREYDDSNDKENHSPIPNNTIEFISKLKPPTSTVIGCNNVLTDPITNESVSPITISTHRMSKAMQVKNRQINLIKLIMIAIYYYYY